MQAGPILERELITLVRSRTVFFDRYLAIALEFAAILGAAWLWDQWGWDRRSLSGVSKFALVLFGLTIAVFGSVTMVQVILQVSRAIATERDQKTLDALLATRLSAAEIILGTLAAGLVRWANGLAAVVPIVVVLVLFGGVDPRLILLAGGGLASTAFAMGAIAVVASIVARTARQAVALATSLTLLWVTLPVLVLVLKPRLWPSGPAWIVRLAIALLTSSPFGVVANLSGMVWLGSPIQVVWRMIMLEWIGGLLLIGWSIWQLRPRARAHDDNEFRIAGLRIRRTIRWRLSRPPCGDDPVLWNAIYANRTASPIARWVGYVINIAFVGGLLMVMVWFAGPAFKELLGHGYGADPAAFRLPDVNPLARALVDFLAGPGAGLATAPGQARLEFNLILKGFSAFFVVFYAIAIFAGTLESLWGERDRDTWLGLIATPLSGWEIVRAKMLGAFYRTRSTLCLIVGFWTVGALAGAIHPIGYLAALSGIAVLGGLSAAMGVYACLAATRRNESTSLIEVLPYLLCFCGVAITLPGRWSVLVAAASPSFLAFSALLTYEDVHAIVHGGMLPTYVGSAINRPGLEARWVLILWLISTLAQAACALAVMRSLARGFDAMVGRPTRPHTSAELP